MLTSSVCCNEHHFLERTDPERTLVSILFEFQGLSLFEEMIVVTERLELRRLLRFPIALAYIYSQLFIFQVPS